MGGVDYILRQQKRSKIANKYDEENAVATISFIRESIVDIYLKCKNRNC